VAATRKLSVYTKKGNYKLIGEFGVYLSSTFFTICWETGEGMLQELALD
jgi:hypothetical protein